MWWAWLDIGGVVDRSGRGCCLISGAVRLSGRFPPGPQKLLLADPWFFRLSSFRDAGSRPEEQQSEHGGGGEKAPGAGPEAGAAE